MIVRKNCMPPSKRITDFKSDVIFHYINDNVVFYASSDMGGCSLQCHIKYLKFKQIKSTETSPTYIVVMPTLIEKQKNKKYKDHHYCVAKSVHRELQRLQQEWKKKKELNESELQKIKVRNALDGLEV